MKIDKPSGGVDKGRRRLLQGTASLVVPSEKISSQVDGVVNLATSVSENLQRRKILMSFSKMIENSIISEMKTGVRAILSVYAQGVHLAGGHFDDVSDDFPIEDHTYAYKCELNEAFWSLRRLGFLDMSQSDFDIIDKLEELGDEDLLRKEYMHLVYRSIPKIGFNQESFEKKFLKEFFSVTCRTESGQPVLTERYLKDIEGNTYSTLLEPQTGNIGIELFSNKDVAKREYDEVFSTSELITPDMIESLEGLSRKSKEILGLIMKFTPEQLQQYRDSDAEETYYEKAINDSEGLVYRLDIGDISEYVLSSYETELLKGKLSDTDEITIDLTSGLEEESEDKELDRLEELEEIYESREFDEGEEGAEEERDEGETLC